MSGVQSHERYVEGGSRTTLVLLALILGVAAVLARQAYQADRDYRDAAERVARDYAHVAAGELLARVQQSVEPASARGGALHILRTIPSSTCEKRNRVRPYSVMKGASMSRIATIFAIIATLIAGAAMAQTNVLVNGDFESNGPPALVNGNNIGHSIAPWVVGSGNQPNVVQVDGPGGYDYGTNGPESDASHPGAGVLQHYLDIANGSNDFYQSFTPKCDGTVEFGGSFSTRADSPATGSVTLRKGVGTTGAIVGVTNVVNLPGGVSKTDPWTPVSFTAVMVAGQTYSFVVSMDDNMNFDNGFVKYIDNCDSGACMSVIIREVTCTGNGTFTVSAVVTNTSGHPTQYVLIAPPPGATYTVSPNVAPVALNNGQSAPITVTVSGALPGQLICLNYLLQDSEGHTCCSVTRCFKLPDCACMRIVDQSVVCDPGPADFIYTFTIQNLTGGVIQQLFAIPSAGTVTPQLIAVNIAPGGSTTVTLHLSGVSAGQAVCIVLEAYGDDLKECCSVKVCIKMPIGPPCDKFPIAR